MRESLKDATRAWRSSSAEETEALGAQLAARRPAGANALITVHLTGDLGAGKTTFARGFLHASGVTGPIRSPTYTLLEVYETARGPVVHLDLYRLQEPSELEPLGLRDLATPGHVWLIEWPERGAGWLPEPDLLLTLSVGTGPHAGTHGITARALTPAGLSWLRALRD